MTLLKTFAGLAALASLGACAAPGPSVPFAQGQNMEVARAAVEACSIYGRQGAVADVDNCLRDRGFDRRKLTTAEMSAIDTADYLTRSALLDHFVAGGQLETFSGS